MSLKDEIERIISAERKKLEVKDKDHADHHERQCQRFQSMRVLLQEIVASVQPDYLQAQINEWSATLELGDKKRGRHAYPHIRWKIEPYQELALSNDDTPFFEEKPGFRVEEMRNHFYLPEPEIEENTYVFATETETAQYLVTEIAKEVAQHRHYASRGLPSDEER